MKKIIFFLLLCCCSSLFAESVNINKADAEEIALKLKGIGLVKAQAIVKYRDKNGAYKSVDDLIKVPGIGGKTLEKIKKLITLKTGRSKK